jgi:hypothetical protein
LYHVKRFIDLYPSEIVILEVKPDYYPINADYAGLGSKKKSQTVRLHNRDNRDLL